MSAPEPEPEDVRRLSRDEADLNLIIFRDIGVIAGQTGTLNLNGQRGFTHYRKIVFWFFAWNSFDLFKSSAILSSPNSANHQP